MTIRQPEDDVSSTTANLSSLSIRTHQQARNPTLVSLEARLNTFQGWPRGLAQRPAQLAEAGFFFMSN